MPLFLGFTCIVRSSGLRIPAPDLQRGHKQSHSRMMRREKISHCCRDATVQLSKEAMFKQHCAEFLPNTDSMQHDTGSGAVSQTMLKDHPLIQLALQKVLFLVLVMWCQIGSVINRRLLFILHSRYRRDKSVLRPQ